jgi:5-formyltetrahydrofolate cyclo-ligase
MLAQCEEFDHPEAARRVSHFDADSSIGPSSGSPSGAETKRDLRRRLLTARRALDPQNRKNHDTTVRETLTSWLAEIKPDTIAAYVPMVGEPGGPELPDALAAVVPRVLLPVVLHDRDLDWAEYTGALADAALGLREPVGPRLGVDAITTADVVLVPALAAGRDGNRLGRGGGSYDRALARVRPGQIVIAALYDGELLDAVPAEPHDRPVHAVVIDGMVTMLSSGHTRRPAGR